MEHDNPAWHCIVIDIADANEALTNDEKIQLKHIHTKIEKWRVAAGKGRLKWNVDGAWKKHVAKGE